MNIQQGKRLYSGAGWRTNTHCIAHQEYPALKYNDKETTVAIELGGVENNDRYRVTSHVVILFT